MRKAFVTALLFVMALAELSHAAAGDEISITAMDVSRLTPGEFIWKPWLAPDGAMSITINLRTQRASVYRDGVRIGATTISAGKRRHRTPTGVFHILQKMRVHRSKKYDNAPMPFTQQFTRWGVALHGGIVPGYPTSHGCVHLPRTFARLLYEETSIGTTVVVTNTSPTLSTDHNPPFKISATETGADSTRWPVAQMPEEQDTAR
ncbi:MAG TPA: L,D-transpeptidase family protein [Rhizomicrobium sp.]|jgi:hypothetical protein|nr:L,D-transpeptidase family protein [Rhizomicrobium sp.]